MWTGIDSMFLGLILVGIGLTCRVMVEGVRETRGLSDKLKQFRVATESCQTKAEEFLVQAGTLEGEVKELEQEFQAVEGRKDHLEKKVRLMKQRLEK